ncbi:uncharacterized protein FIBRA_01157 [Fibroporia radiculosa]|uniref:Cyclin N-terminal domain-containing protein n=1 Tax=Fibroporia radiculosa TaxID=599839 RepID=J4HSV0_9APHY|nr:uncharacterized protein FIBRA_01157 [Fibroporia radiculosa]CCL99142.1 predicted protein [Fibroporia radiculosa]
MPECKGYIVGATTTAPSLSQWIFPVSALQNTPSRTTSSISQDTELYDRARGIEFLFRLGVSLQLPISAMYTAATWFHRFYMRFSMEDYHRQGSGRILSSDQYYNILVIRMSPHHVARIDIADIADDSKELEAYQTAILLTEEALLEALCFDFVVDSPHAELVDLFTTRRESNQFEECAWSMANDTARTPLCILYPPRIIAAACYILAQYVIEGPQSPSLDIRIASPAPSTSLPTPPSHKFVSPDASRFAVEFFAFNEVDLVNVAGSCLSSSIEVAYSISPADALTIMLEFYAAQDLQNIAAHLSSVASIPPPGNASSRQKLYSPSSGLASAHPHQAPVSRADSNQTPTSPPDGNTPNNLPSGSWKPLLGDLNVSGTYMVDTHVICSYLWDILNQEKEIFTPPNHHGIQEAVLGANRTKIYHI